MLKACGPPSSQPRVWNRKPCCPSPSPVLFPNEFSGKRGAGPKQPVDPNALFLHVLKIIKNQFICQGYPRGLGGHE